MAYSSRLVGRDVSLLTFDGADVIGLFRRCDIRLNMTTVNTTAVMDSGSDFRPNHYSGTVSFSKLKEAGSESWLEKLRSSQFADVVFSMEIDGKTISGRCTYNSLNFPVSEEALTDEIEFQLRRELYVDNNAIVIGPNYTVPLAAP